MNNVGILFVLNTLPTNQKQKDIFLTQEYKVFYRLKTWLILHCFLPSAEAHCTEFAVVHRI